ncbi:autotransporter beta-domain protein [Orientia tsutsugamushi str. Gilliam]|uniref:Autotransporter beta-domain protein n=1 Tax=Orientia tsutsugamushi str. Gilliam TaxID=1359184 RepID=A0A0F3MB98_ORITS|nr:autotransporter domain-containing protein [Orientia tsutsugamushi]KJV53040.1 autotransporter beta-domain protein [Orientia tsutsugamushi str. Gilliam]SPR04753.1 ScaE autotransporter protein [Orientia tsutsugamushi str. Gilliam]
MIKINKKVALIKVSLIFSALFFIGNAQSIFNVNAQSNSTKQDQLNNKINQIDARKFELVQQQQNLERDREKIYNRIDLEKIQSHSDILEQLLLHPSEQVTVYLNEQDPHDKNYVRPRSNMLHRHINDAANYINNMCTLIVDIVPGYTNNGPNAPDPARLITMTDQKAQLSNKVKRFGNRIRGVNNANQQCRAVTTEINELSQALNQFHQALGNVQAEIQALSLPSLNDLSTEVRKLHLGIANQLVAIDQGIQVCEQGSNSMLKLGQYEQLLDDLYTISEDIVQILQNHAQADNAQPITEARDAEINQLYQQMQVIEKRMPKFTQDLRILAKQLRDISCLIATLDPRAKLDPAQIGLQQVQPGLSEKIRKIINDIINDFPQVLQQYKNNLENDLKSINHKIANIDQLVSSLNQKLEALQQEQLLSDQIAPTKAITSFEKQQPLHQVAQHNAMLANAISFTADTAVSATTSILSKIATVQNQSPKIISSGSNIYNSNGWNIDGNVFCGKTKKIEHKEIQGYSTDISGAFITVNKYLNKKVVIGVTGLYSNLDITYGQNVILNKTNCKVYSLSLNGRYYPRQDIFMQSIVGLIKYDGTTRYYADVQPSSNIDGKGWYGDFMLAGNVYPLKHNSKLTFSPIVGIVYTNSSHAFETTIRDIDYNILTGRAGITIKYVIDNINNNMSIVPEFHAFIHRLLCVKSNQLEYVNSDIAEQIPQSLGQLGVGVTVWHGKVGIGISYSAYLANEYISHIGSANIKASF